MDKRAILAMASILAAGANGAAQVAAPYFPRLRARERTGKRYPEQSSRQAMRGHRRAQGGPGIVLVDGMYLRAH